MTMYCQFKEWLISEQNLPPKLLKVGIDIPNFFLHGTNKKTAMSIGLSKPDDNWREKILGKSTDPRNAALFLTEPDHPGDAAFFASGHRSMDLFVVTLKPNSLLLDLTEEIPVMATNGNYFKMVKRPAITDDFIEYMVNQRGEKYREDITKNIDLNYGKINAYTWIIYLIPFAKYKGWAGVRHIDEILLTDQKYIHDIRPTTKEEKIKWKK